jgi:hypothetical protein
VGSKNLGCFIYRRQFLSDEARQWKYYHNYVNAIERKVSPEFLYKIGKQEDFVGLNSARHI